MNLQYHYRWFYVLGLCAMISCFSYYGYLQEDIETWQDLVSDLHQLDIQQVSSPFTVADLSRSSSKPNDFLSKLMLVIQQQGFIVQAVNAKTIAWNQLHGVQVTITLQGDFARWLNFLMYFNHHSIPVFLREWQFKVLDNTELIIVMTMDYLPSLTQSAPLPQQRNVIPYQFNPFCHAQTLQEQNQLVDQQAQQVSVKVLRFVGFLNANHQRHAFIKLPTNRLLSVALGSVVGKERGLVTTVANDHIVMTLADKQRFILPLNNDLYNEDK